LVSHTIKDDVNIHCLKQFRLVRDNRPTLACRGQTIGLSDNEYFQSGAGNAQYFAELEAVYHNSSIVVPLTYNDPGQDGNFVNGTVGLDFSLRLRISLKSF
jgi:hypothetical protein